MADEAFQKLQDLLQRQANGEEGLEGLIQDARATAQREAEEAGDAVTEQLGTRIPPAS